MDSNSLAKIKIIILNNFHAFFFSSCLNCQVNLKVLNSLRIFGRFLTKSFNVRRRHQKQQLQLLLLRLVLCTHTFILCSLVLWLCQKSAPENRCTYIGCALLFEAEIRDIFKFISLFVCSYSKFSQFCVLNKKS